MALFLRFMGWFILYSLFYFISLDITLDPPGTENSVFHKVFNYGILLILSIPVWWFSWKKFELTFGPKATQTLEDGRKAYRFALRNPALMYYLMVLKVFLLAMGLNGILTLSHHKGGLRTFYIINFIVLYLYALPFFIIKFKKLQKALASRLIVDDRKLALETAGEIVTEIPLSGIEKIISDDAASGMLVQAGGAALYVGGRHAKGSAFFLEGAQEVCQKLKGLAQDKVENVDSIKQALKSAGIKPAV